MRRDTSIAISKPTVSTNSVKEGLMRVAAIYGANASGKTGFLDALNTLRSLVMYSFRRSGSTEPSRKLAREPFLTGRLEPTTFSIVFIATDKKKYQYDVGLNDERVLYESLAVYKTAKSTLIYERELENEQYSYNFGSIIPKEKADVLKTLIENTPNVLLLSAALQLKEKSLSHAYNFFTNNLKMHNFATVSQEAEELKLKLRKEKDVYDILQKMLPAADFGICGVDAEEREGAILMSNQAKDILKDAMRQIIKLQSPNMPDDELNKMTEGDLDERPISLVFKHRLGGSELSLDQRFESSGTIVATVFFSNLVEVLKNGLVYVVDEIDCSLHPTLVAQLIEVFNSDEANPFGAQLVFTTHDVSILDSSIYGDNLLDRDEIWFVEKDEQGQSTIYPLTSIGGTRKEDNYYKKYIQGRYGAIPRVSILNEVINYWETQNAKTPQ